MTRAVVLDTGVIGLLTYTKGSPENELCDQWQASLRNQGVRVCIPEIADYEIRRELLRFGFAKGIAKLDALISILDYMPIDRSVMRKAAEFWAEVRRRGKPTADDRALDGDVILAAQAVLLVEQGFDVIVATTNVGHLSRFVQAKLWNEIS